MLAPLLLAALISCLLIMLMGWVRDIVRSDTDAGDTCPLFPPSPNRMHGA